MTASRPERYERWYDTWFGQRTDRVERALLGRLLAGIPQVESVLEVGCGTGHFMDVWMKHRPIGLDKDAEMLRFAHRRWPEVPLVVGDACALPFRDHSVDVAALVTALEFIAQPADVLQEAARVAQRGIVVVALSRGSPVAWYRRLRRARAYRDAHFYTARELRLLVRRCVDRPLELQIERTLYPHPWFDHFHSLPCGALIGLSAVFR